QLLVSGNTNVTLQAADAVTLNIAGAAGADLSVAAGATLQATGTNAITLAIASGATGDVFGTTSLAGGAHRITAADAGALVYESGSTFTAGTGLSGSPVGATSLNSVVFQPGSPYHPHGGRNPFRAPAP